MGGHGKSRFRVLTSNSFIVIILINLFICSLVGSALIENYHHYRERAVQSAQDLSLVLAEGLGGLFDRIDFALLSIDDLVQSELASDHPNHDRIEGQLQAWHQRLPLLSSIRVLDREGMVRYGKSDGSGVALSDRDYFVALRANPAMEIAISKPMVGRITHDWQIVLARAIKAPDGGFDGVVLVSLPLEAIVKMFSALHLGKDGAVALRSAGDLSVVARYPETVGSVSAINQTAISSQLQEAVQTNPQGGSYVAKARIDGIERVLSYQKIDVRPLYIVVGLATADTMAEWRASAMPIIGGLIFFMAVTVLGGIYITRMWRLRGEAAEHLRVLAADHERFSEILAHHLQEPVRQQHIFTQKLAASLPKPLSNDVRENLDHILRGANRQRALLRDVRTYLALTQDRDDGPPWDATAAAAKLLRGFEARLTAVQAQVTLGDLPPLPLSQKSFVLLLSALLENAIDYRCPDRPLTISIEGGRLDHQVFLAVTDNGLGIDPDFRSRVFNVFERLSGQDEEDGTGIGLAMVRKIAETAGGAAEITDGNEGGIRVTVTLPRRRLA